MSWKLSQSNDKIMDGSYGKILTGFVLLALIALVVYASFTKNLWVTVTSFLLLILLRLDIRFKASS